MPNRLAVRAEGDGVSHSFPDRRPNPFRSERVRNHARKTIIAASTPAGQSSECGNRFGKSPPPCPGCGSPPATMVTLTTFARAQRMGEFFCGIVELRPLPTTPNSFPDPSHQQRAGPFWRQLPPSQVRMKNAAMREPRNAATSAPARHSVDFHAPSTGLGLTTASSATQAACVRVLWEAWEDGTPGISAGNDFGTPRRPRRRASGWSMSSNTKRLGRDDREGAEPAGSYRLAGKPTSG